MVRVSLPVDLEISSWAMPVDALLWLLPGAVGGSLLAMLPALQGRQRGAGSALLRLSLFTSLLNIAAALA